MFCLCVCVCVCVCMSVCVCVYVRERASIGVVIFGDDGACAADAWFRDGLQSLESYKRLPALLNAFFPISARNPVTCSAIRAMRPPPTVRYGHDPAAV
jgi:hypothetical protein